MSRRAFTLEAVVDQQFQYALEIVQAGVMALPGDARIILKLTIPTLPGRYADLAADPRVLQVLALSGGYRRDEACGLLAKEPSMIASFARALLEGLTVEQIEEQFAACLDASIGQIYDASVDKLPPETVSE